MLGLIWWTDQFPKCEMQMITIGRSTAEFTLVDYPTVDDKFRDWVLKNCDRMKQEANKK